MELSKLIATHNEIAARAELADLALAYVGLKEWAERFAERRLHGVFQVAEDADPGNRYAVHFEASDLSPEERRLLDDLLADEGSRDLADDLARAGWGEFFSLEGTFEAFEKDFVAPLARALQLRGVELDA